MPAMLPISSREYKVMLDHRMFANSKSASNLCRELHACAARLKNIECDGKFNETQTREIAFLDTRDETINLNGFVFRQRVEEGKTEYTLKCRSPDRYVAAGADVQSSKGMKGEKLEEDIGAPFVCRFSHSNTVKGRTDAPKTLKQAAQLFPTLAKLKRDGQACSDELELRPVNSMNVFERVLSGPTLRFDSAAATVALILWSDGPDGRPLVAEFSFRYRDRKEEYATKAARLAMRFFEELQRLDWCVPEGRTKTQYAYRER